LTKIHMNIELALNKATASLLEETVQT